MSAATPGGKPLAGLERLLIIGTGAPNAFSLPQLVATLHIWKVDVRVCLTRAAAKLVSPLAVAAASGHPVIADRWQADGSVSHMQWAEWPELVVVWPATLDFLARCAHGMADDVPAAVVLATAAPVLFAPSLSPRAVRGGPYERARDLLRQDGHTVADPVAGISMFDGTSSDGACINGPQLFEEISRLRSARATVPRGRVAT